MRFGKKYPSLKPGHKLCTACYEEVGKLSPNQAEVAEQAVDTESSGSDSFSADHREKEVSTDENREVTSAEQEHTSDLSENVASPSCHLVTEKINETLAVAGVSPVAAYKVRSSSAAIAKSSKVQSLVRKTLAKSLALNTESSESDDTGKNVDFRSAGKDMLSQLKEKLSLCESFNEKPMVLSVVPRSWTVNQIQKYFGVSRYMASKNKALVTNKGILSGPGKKNRTPITTRRCEQSCRLLQE